MLINHHGFVFEIDTTEWSDPDGRTIAEGVLIDGIRRWDTSLTNKIHDALMAFETGIGDASDDQAAIGYPTVLDKVSAIEHAARLEGTAGWKFTPERGHRCAIVAIPS